MQTFLRSESFSTESGTETSTSISARFSALMQRTASRNMKCRTHRPWKRTLQLSQWSLTSSAWQFPQLLLMTTSTKECRTWTSMSLESTRGNRRLKRRQLKLPMGVKAKRRAKVAISGSKEQSLASKLIPGSQLARNVSISRSRKGSSPRSWEGTHTAPIPRTF